MAKKFKSALSPKERDGFFSYVSMGNSLFPDAFKNQPFDTPLSYKFFCPWLLLFLGFVTHAFRS